MDELLFGLFGSSDTSKPVKEPYEGMLFRASNGVLYKLRWDEAAIYGESKEQCSCCLYADLNCLDIDVEAFGRQLADAYHWYPVEENKCRSKRV